jgi:hypothetical protein
MIQRKNKKLLFFGRCSEEEKMSKPRIVHCCEDFPKHIGLPRGCLEDTNELVHSVGIETRIIDERFGGERVKAEFVGTLKPEQLMAADALLEHDTGVLSVTYVFSHLFL